MNTVVSGGSPGGIRSQRFVCKSLYLSIIGLLRAQHAPSVSLLHRYGCVRRGSNSFNLAEKNSAPSACKLEFAYCVINKNSSSGSFGGATLFTAFKYSRSAAGRLGRLSGAQQNPASADAEQ
jgi:hypothetical protein